MAHGDRWRGRQYEIPLNGVHSVSEQETVSSPYHANVDMK